MSSLFIITIVDNSNTPTQKAIKSIVTLCALHYDLSFFFMEKDKANERAGHLMVSDHRRPRPRATPEELQVRCRSLK